MLRALIVVMILASGSFFLKMPLGVGVFSGAKCKLLHCGVAFLGVSKLVRVSLRFLIGALMLGMGRCSMDLLEHISLGRF